MQSLILPVTFTKFLALISGPIHRIALSWACFGIFLSHKINATRTVAHQRRFGAV